jgi:hypothetical protein
VNNRERLLSAISHRHWHLDAALAIERKLALQEAAQVTCPHLCGLTDEQLPELQRWPRENADGWWHLNGERCPAWRIHNMLKLDGESAERQTDRDRAPAKASWRANR